MRIRFAFESFFQPFRSLLMAVGAAFVVCILSLFVRLLLIRQPDNTMASTKVWPLRVTHSLSSAS